MIDKQIDGQAVPFIMIKERLQGDIVKLEFELTQQATQVFNSIKNKKIAVASIAGPQRTGKSFLSNRLLKRMTGFAIGPTTMPCTKGLWIWGKPVDIDSETVLIIMDTEGLNSVQRDINVDLKIFALSILLSSVFIYNSIGHIDQKALQNMSYVLRISENLKVTKQNVEKQSQMASYFPHFYWVLRDFSLDLGSDSQSQYLQRSLRQISKDKSDPKNQIRQKIRNLFIHRRCECFPRPITEENKLAHIQKLEYKDLREKFRIKMEEFQKNFYETLPLKTIKGKPITGGIYLNLIREYIEAMNTGKVPEILTSLQRVLESEARTISEDLRKKYNEAMIKVFDQNEGPVDESFMEYNHRRYVKQIELKLHQKFRNWNQISKTGEYKTKFIQSLESDFKQKLKRNNQLSENICATELNKFFNEYNFNELTSLEVLEKNNNFLREKFDEFTKKIKPYFEKGKNPRKFTYFVEKFPKKIYDFFDLLISRIKGFYNEQMMRLRAEVKNAQGESDSVKRIMKEQENLLSEKQKQLELICYERDNYRREIEKAEKLKEFEKQTDKMNKGQLKSNLELYKTQVVDLEQRVEELEEENKRLKQQAQRLERQGGKGGKKFDIANFLQGGSTTAASDQASNNEWQNHGDLPNEVVSNLSGLKSKLSSMLTFYEQKLTDDALTVDESILAQLQRLRTQKHEALEKLRSEFRAKQEKYRQQKNKDREHYESTIEVLNKHLDDIKNQNIELHEKVNGRPESEQRIKNYLQERKKLEESIKLKQNNINSLSILNKQVQKKYESLESRYNEIEAQLAMLKAEKANFESYKETFAFILRESLNWVTNKNNKLKHSVKTLTNEDMQMIKAVFKELDYNPF